ncbi:MAG: transporter substrate-binding protein [Acidimicrobiales bacterium]|jgi:hypothetical protein|nr:transporter substrate-binding protein [Acidimicrobiales bacterium]
MTRNSVRIGSGSAGAIDRVELAVDMVRGGDVKYLALDCLAERTLALAQLRKSAGTGPGYDPRVPAFGKQLLPLARERGVTVIANMGAADPHGALEHFQEHADAYGLRGLKVAVIDGDDVLDHLKQTDPVVMETNRRVSELANGIVSANAYIGYERIFEALADGADLVIGGRIADSSLFLAPLAYELGWAADDWDRLAAGTCVGHLLECGTYVTGGNFADPPFTTIDDFDNPSLPMADVSADGTAVLRKLPGSGGRLDTLTCKLQLAYEVHDPTQHRSPDVISNFAGIEVSDSGDGGVAIRGATGTPRPEQLKVVVGVAEGFIGENQISYAGAGALDRAMLAKGILERRIGGLASDRDIEEWRVDLLGVNALHGNRSSVSVDAPPYEVHVRGAARCGDRRAAEAVAAEVEYLMLWGPAGAAAGHRARIAQIVSAYSAFVDRDDVSTRLTMCTL